MFYVLHVMIFFRNQRIYSLGLEKRRRKTSQPSSKLLRGNEHDSLQTHNLILPFTNSSLHQWFVQARAEVCRFWVFCASTGREIRQADEWGGIDLQCQHWIARQIQATSCQRRRWISINWYRYCGFIPSQAENIINDGGYVPKQIYNADKTGLSYKQRHVSVAGEYQSADTDTAGSYLVKLKTSSMTAATSQSRFITLIKQAWATKCYKTGLCYEMLPNKILATQRRPQA